MKQDRSEIMSRRERRLRDDTGDSVYCDIDEINEVQSTGVGTSPVYLSYSAYGVGAGVFDTMKNVATKAVTKLTGKAAKKIASKAVEKAAEKVGEKTGQKIGDLIGEKIYDTFSHSETPKGDQIVKELSTIEIPGETRKVKTHVKPQAGHRPVSQPQAGHRSVPGNTLPRETQSISQQFDELLLRFQ